MTEPAITCPHCKTEIKPTDAALHFKNVNTVQIGKRPLDFTYAESIKPIRNRIRRYSYQSLLDAILVYLNMPSTSSGVKDLQRLPWVAERLAIWLFADKAFEYGSQIATGQDV